MKTRQFIVLCILLLLILVTNIFYTNSIRLKLEGINNEVRNIKTLTDNINDKLYHLKSDVWIMRISQ